MLAVPDDQIDINPVPSLSGSLLSACSPTTTVLGPLIHFPRWLVCWFACSDQSYSLIKHNKPASSFTIPHTKDADRTCAETIRPVRCWHRSQLHACCPVSRYRANRTARASLKGKALKNDQRTDGTQQTWTDFIQQDRIA